MVVPLHVLWGASAEQCTPELALRGAWRAGWRRVRQESEWKHNLIALGDFLTDRKRGPNYEASPINGPSVPAEPAGLPPTIFTTDPEKLKVLGQIAWFTKGATPPDLGYHGHRRHLRLHQARPHRPSIVGRCPSALRPLRAVDRTRDESPRIRKPQGAVS